MFSLCIALYSQHHPMRCLLCLCWCALTLKYRKAKLVPFSTQIRWNHLPIIICELFIPKYEITLSVANTNIEPNKNPPATGINAYSPLRPYMPELTASSMAGASSDQNDAAIMTPAANPSAISRDFLCCKSKQRSRILINKCHDLMHDCTTSA